MQITTTEGKHTFTLNVDIEDILSQIEKSKDDFEPNFYNHYGESAEWDDACLTKEEFEQNVTDFYNKVKKALTEDNLKDIIAKWPRKKNGTFNRRLVKEIAACDNCNAIHEWHNTWIYDTVRVTAFNDTRLSVTVYQKTDTPG